MARKYISNPDVCTITQAMNLLGSKWKPLIIYILACRRSVRFGMLNTRLPSISKKILTDQLRELEADGLIIRESFSELPPRVEYHLSEKAQGLLPILRNLSEWVAENYPDQNFMECRIPENLDLT